jgi:uncharacterized membrane protein
MALYLSESSDFTRLKNSRKKDKKIATKNATVTDRMQIIARFGFTFLFISGITGGSRITKL